MEKLKSIATAEEEQMRRIGRFLHDEVGGNMHVLLHLLEKKTNQANPEYDEILQQASILTRKSIDSVRNTSQELVPYFLLNFGLDRTLRSMVNDAQNAAGVRMSYNSSLQWSPEQLSHDLTIQLYRIAQEIFSNLLRHAKPSEVLVNLYTQPSFLKVEFTHNGIGLSQQEYEHQLISGKSLGLKNIDYRAKILQATLKYHRGSDQSRVEIAMDTSEIIATSKKHN
jgi:signal transduction histidine kinase